MENCFLEQRRSESVSLKLWCSSVLWRGVVVWVCSGGDQADDVRGSDVRPPLDWWQRGRDLPQKDQVGGGGPSGAAAGHVNAPGPTAVSRRSPHTFSSRQKWLRPTNPIRHTRDGRVSGRVIDGVGFALISFMLRCFTMYTSAGFSLYYGGSGPVILCTKQRTKHDLYNYLFPNGEEMIVIYSITYLISSV